MPEQAAITFARTRAGQEGQRLFVAAAPLAPQFYVFDEKWKRLRTFPAADQTPLAVTDLALADVDDADGSPEVLAANVQEIGLVAVGLDGKPLWRNAALANAVLRRRRARSSATDSWAIFVAGEHGTVLRVNRYGHEEPAKAVGQWPIFRLAAARFAGATQAAMLGLSNNPQGKPVAVGITGQLEGGAGTIRCRPAPISGRSSAVTSGNLLPGRKGEWWLAGPDGSIHVVSEDGEVHDSFHYGAAPHRPGRDPAGRRRRCCWWPRTKA